MKEGDLGVSKKGAGTNHGSGGKLKVCELKKVKKRRLLIISDSESDEFVSTSRKVDQNVNASVDQKNISVGSLDGNGNGSVDSKNKSVGSLEVKGGFEIDKKKTRLDPIGYLEDTETSNKRIRVDGNERKSSKNDPFAFREDDVIDRKKIKMETLKYKEEMTDDLDRARCRARVEGDRKKIKMETLKRKEEMNGDLDRRRERDVGDRKIKMETLNCNEEMADDLDRVRRRERDEGDRKIILEAGMKRKRGSADSLKCREGEESDREKKRVESWKFRAVKVENKAESRVSGPKLVAPIARQREGERECNRSKVIDEIPRSDIHRKGNLVVERIRGSDVFDKKRFRLEKGEIFCSAGLPAKKFTVPRSEGIRLQGKGGVLKLMPSNKMKVGVSEKTYDRRGAEENRRDPRISSISHRNVLLGSSLARGKQCREGSDSSIKIGKNHLNMRKSLSTEKIKACDLQREKNVALQIESNKMDARGTKGESISALGIPLPTKKKEKGSKSDRLTEKQRLRDRIKGMLLNAGWKIENRRRKDRNYQDAVYISPKGTAYWSIMNAYRALQKELNSENRNGDCGAFTGNDHELNETSSPFSVIPVEVLSILTRRRVKKKVKHERDNKLRNESGGKNAKEVTKINFVNNKHVKGNASNCKMKEKVNSRIAFGGKLSKASMKENASVGSKMEGAVRSSTSSYPSDKVGSTNGESGKGSSPVRAQISSLTSDANLLNGRKNNKQRGCALLARSSNKWASLDTDDFKPYDGKRTVLSWLIDSGTVPENGKVQYMNKTHTRALLEGWIRRDGIHCSCCSKILTVSKFEIHSGTKMRQPFQNIFVETGISLLQCQLDAWDKQEESERRGLHFIDIEGDDPNDDTCGICGDGGDLICCDGCPSTYHLRCLNIQMLPPGDWHCPNCSCKFCGVVDGSNSQGEGVTLIPILSCSQCEEKYHQQCMRETTFIPVDSNSPGISFCGKNCRKLFERLEKLLGAKHDLEVGFSWTLIKRFDENSRTSPRALAQRAECNSKLAVALAVMDECFMPIIEQSGINLIHNVLYNCGSNFNRLNYSGFYTIILERGDEIIAAASIRIHGTRLAEMPFIGTRHIYRRQGMCRRLLNAIELVLCSLHVEKLIIPAIAELMQTWTMVFGFKPLEESHREELRSMNMLVFPGTDLLHKQLLMRECSEGITTADTGSEVDGFEEGMVHDTNETKDTVSANDPGPTCNISEVQKPLDASHGSNFQTFAERSICYNSESQYKVPVSSTNMSFIHVAHPDKPDVENQSLVTCPIEPKLQSSDACSVHDTHEVAVDLGGGEPNLHAFGETSEVIGESPDAISGSNFQDSALVPNSLQSGSDKELILSSCNAYHNNQAVSEKMLVYSAFEPNIHSSSEITEHNTHGVNSGDASIEHNAHALGEDSVHYSSEVVSVSLNAASMANSLPSDEGQRSELLSKSYDRSSGLPLSPASDVASNNVHEVDDKSLMAFPSEPNCHTSGQRGAVLDAHGVEDFKV
ncbi:uncharacterized protein LOC143881387 isoform X2 [Tasmannia lanceolata]|uniref:uncharacterized protein LOC143881387 isoform X2 n=1 Tax=Tasmannia lanceolata TaxID=3420 RepID=UPI0040627C7F